jgi:hypothetical protein
MQISHVAARFGGLTQGIGEFLHVLRRGISAHAIFWALIGLYYLAYLFVHCLRPDLLAINLLRGSLSVLWLSAPLLLFSSAVLRLYHVVRFEQPEQPTIAILRDWARFAVNPQRMANGLPMVFIMVVFAFIFADLQGKILALNPAVWDATFANLDKALHFGRQPWEWLQPIQGSPFSST